MTKRGPYQCGHPMGIVYKDNFKNFFQMMMFFLAYIVTFLGQLHFTRNYFFTVNPSAQQYLVRHNSYAFRAATFSERYFLSAIILSKQLLIRSKTSTDNFYQLLILQGSQFFKTATMWEDKFIQDIYCYLQKNLFFEAESSTKHQIFPGVYSEPLQTSKMECFCVIS